MPWNVVAGLTSVAAPLVAQWIAQRQMAAPSIDPEVRDRMTELMEGRGMDPRSRQIMTEDARRTLATDRDRAVRDAEQSAEDRGMWQSSLTDQHRAGIEGQHSEALARAYANIAMKDSEIRQQQQMAGTQMASEYDRWRDAAQIQQDHARAVGWGEALGTGGAELVRLFEGDTGGALSGLASAFMAWLRGQEGEGAVPQTPQEGAAGAPGTTQVTPGESLGTVRDATRPIPTGEYGYAPQGGAAGAHPGPFGEHSPYWETDPRFQGMSRFQRLHNLRGLQKYPAPTPLWQHYGQFGLG